MNGKYLLDTNVVIALFAGRQAVTRMLEEAPEVFLPSIVVGELYYGALNSSRIDENLERINRLASISSVLSCDVGTAQQYGMIKNQLKNSGRPIPENDIWIAAISRQYGLVLVTYDRHSEHVEGLSVYRW